MSFLRKDVQIIHDWDYPYIGKRTALKRCLQYAMHLLFLLLKREPPLATRYELRDQAEAMSLLEEMLNIESTFYLRPEVQEAHMDFLADLPKVGIHFHFHNSMRDKGWIPALQGKTRWKRSEFAHTCMGGVERNPLFTSSVVNVHVRDGNQILTYLQTLKKLRVSRTGLRQNIRVRLSPASHTLDFLPQTPHITMRNET